MIQRASGIWNENGRGKKAEKKWPMKKIDRQKWPFPSPPTIFFNYTAQKNPEIKGGPEGRKPPEWKTLSNFENHKQFV